MSTSTINHPSTDGRPAEGVPRSNRSPVPTRGVHEAAAPTVTRLPGTELRRLVAGAVAGDEACWTRLVAHLSPLIRNVARRHRLSPSDIDDVCQSTWCALVAHISALRDPERLPGWLATTARRESLRVLARARRQVPSGDELSPDDPDTAPLDGRLLRQERDVALWAAVKQLRSSDQRLLRLLVATDQAGVELSYRQIAETLGVAIGSVGPTRGRALERLRGALDQPTG